MAIEKSGKCIEDEWKGVHFSMPKDVKLLVESFAKDRKQKKQYVLTLLICAVMVSLLVAWCFKLTGISATADDTEMAEALEAMQKLNAMEEESTQESSPQDTEMMNDTDDAASEDVKTDNTESDSAGENDESNTDVNTDASDVEDEEQVDDAETQNVELLAETENGITVTVEGDDDAFPYPADELTIEAKKVDDSDVVTLRDEIMEDEDVQAMDHILLSVSVFHEGEEVELTGPVNVTFSGIDTDGYETKVYQIDAETQDGEEMDSSVDEDGDVTVETDSFAVYDVSLLAETAGDYTVISTTDGFKNISNGGKYRLNSDIVYGGYISIPHDTILDLAGYKIYYTGNNILFEISYGGKLTIEDSGEQSDAEENFNGTYGNIASLEFVSDGNMPTKLTYYVTQSNVNSDEISTTEITKKHTMKPSGCIVGENTDGNGALVKVGATGTFNLTGGLLTIRHGDSYSGNSHIVYNDGTMNMSGGYICGGKSTGWAGGIFSGSNSTLNIKGGVIAANEGTNGGGVCVSGGTFTMSGGIISGNQITGTPTAGASDRNCGFGGGVYAFNTTVTISGDAYITNNRMGVTNSTEARGNGCHGGGGIATEGGTLTMSGGYVTGNYSKEAGGGLYVGHYSAGENGNKSKFEMIGGTVAANYADTSEGGGIRISGYTDGIIGAKRVGTDGADTSATKTIYITNNMTKSDYDWGGGGIFVQANGSLQILNTSITDNTAGGFGGGVGACPTGETLITHNNGAAIYNNHTENNGSYNEKLKHMSNGGHGKTYDKDQALASKVFYNDGSGHFSDYFCVKSKEDADGYISLITGTMLGGGGVTWNGSCDDKEITINKSGYAAAKFMFGLDATPEEGAVDKATAATKVFITGNTAYTHGGGIMTNGKLVLGEKTGVTNTSALSMTGTKEFTWQDGKEIADVSKEFQFELTDAYGNVLSTVSSDKDTGEFTISTGTEYKQEGTYTYYLQEKKETDANIQYDETKYKIVVKVVADTATVLGVTFTNYRIYDVTITKVGGATLDSLTTPFEIYYPKRADWNSTYIYTWIDNNGKTEPEGAWPGKILEDNVNGYYKYQLSSAPNGTFKCIFNNGKSGTDEAKTADLVDLYAYGRKVWLDANGAVELSIQSDTVDLSAIKNTDGTCSIEFNGNTFTNLKIYQYELPATGGTGTFKFAIGGLFLMTGSLLYGYSLKRRRERRARS